MHKVLYDQICYYLLLPQHNFLLKTSFSSRFFFFFFFYRAANASQFTYSTYVLDSSPSSVNASRLGFLICSIKIIDLLPFLISLSIVSFVYLIAGLNLLIKSSIFFDL